MPTDEEIDAAARAMIRTMFAAHELPLGHDLEAKYRYTAQCALEAAEKARHRRAMADDALTRS